jgi:hypothetical protein
VHFASKGCQWRYSVCTQSLFWDVLLQ